MLRMHVCDYCGDLGYLNRGGWWICKKCQRALNKHKSLQALDYYHYRIERWFFRSVFRNYAP